MGRTTADNEKEEYDNEADDDDADNAEESEGEEFEQETAWESCLSTSCFVWKILNAGLPYGLSFIWTFLDLLFPVAYN